MTGVATHGRSPDRAPIPSWRPVASESNAVAVWDRTAIGTTARVALWPRTASASALSSIDLVIDALDRQVSRFRADSELSVAMRNHGKATLLSEGAAEALTIALAAARVTDGAVDPTVGGALESLGYDRDFSAIDPDREAGPATSAPGWQSVRLADRVLQVPAGCHLDLGATAKGLGADRAAAAARSASGVAGVLVSLGGDVAAAGRPPVAGWPVSVSEEPSSRADAPVVRLQHGGVATSSVLHRRWRQRNEWFHHVVDPRTGQPATGQWRTATVAARCCAEANVASTAALVMGADAESWLDAHDLPGRLVDHRGAVRLVGRWPTTSMGVLPLPIPSIFEPKNEGRAA
jgi:thiamine biosynthesis lipoprotein